MTDAKKDIDVTPEELDRIGKALKDEKFRTLFFDYCKEISDPENRAKYELEIQQLEKERGFDVKFVKPEAGHVIKVIDTTKNEKVFINVCTNPNVEVAKVSGQRKRDGQRSVNGENWVVPHILNPPRADVDKAGKECRVCDVMFHPDVYSKATQLKEMMKMLNNIALDSSEEKFNLKLDRHNIKYPKMKYKGLAEATLLRNKDSSNPNAKIDEYLSKFVNYPQVTTASSREGDGTTDMTSLNGDSGTVIEEMKPLKDNDTATVPRYKIVHRGHFEWQDYTMARSGVTSTRPAELCVEIELPTMKSANGVDVDIIERKLILNCEKPRYHLEINLPYPVDEDRGTAMFDKSKRSLIVTLPVIKSSTDISMECVEQESEDFLPGVHARNLDQPPSSEHEDAKDQNKTSEPRFPLEEDYQHALSPVFADSKPQSAKDIRKAQEKGHCKGNMSAGFKVDDSRELQKQNCCSQRADGTGSFSDAQRTEDVLHDLSPSGGNSTATSERAAISEEDQANGNLVCNASISDVGKLGGVANDEQMLITTTNDHLLLTGRGTWKDCEITRIECEDDGVCMNMSENIGDGNGLCVRVAGGDGPVEETMASVSPELSEELVSDQEAEEAASQESEPPAMSSERTSDVCHCSGVSNDRLKEAPIRIDAEKLPESERMAREKVHDNANYTENKKIDGHGALRDRTYECLMTTKPTLSDITHVLLEGDEVALERDCSKVKESSDLCSLVDDMAEDDIEVSINIDGLADLSGMNQLPPIDYDQDEQTVTVNIKLKDVKIEDISLGFSSRKAYFSMMSAKEYGDPVRWCLLVKFMEYCRLDKDLCSVDVEKDRVVLTMPKSEASYGLWHRIFIGTSESSLQEMFFMTDHSMSELLGRLHQEENPWAKAAVDIASDSTNEEGSEVVARRLEQLLREQEQGFTECSEASIVGEEGITAPDHSSLSTNIGGEEPGVVCKNVLKSRKETKDEARTETNSTSSDFTVDLTLDELQDDVILEGSAPVLTPERLSRLPIERSNSDETSLGFNVKLRSILKRSQSESANGLCGNWKYGENRTNSMFSTSPSTRVRSQSLNTNTTCHPQGRVGRHRNKSVSFDPEPKVCEFVEYSKKQLKKMRKQERKQTETAAKKIEAAAKKAAGKNKGCKGGKNKHFFNGFKRDSSKSDESETETDTAHEKVKPAAALKEDSTSSAAKADASKPDSIAKPTRKSKTKKNMERKDERTSNQDSRTSSTGGRLMNPLIYELDE